jgi:hypothetical protein
MAIGGMDTVPMSDAGVYPFPDPTPTEPGISGRGGKVDKRRDNVIKVKGASAERRTPSAVPPQRQYARRILRSRTCEFTVSRAVCRRDT